MPGSLFPGRGVPILGGRGEAGGVEGRPSGQSRDGCGPGRRAGTGGWRGPVAGWAILPSPGPGSLGGGWKGPLDAAEGRRLWRSSPGEAPSRSSGGSSSGGLCGPRRGSGPRLAKSGLSNARLEAGSRRVQGVAFAERRKRNRFSSRRAGLEEKLRCRVLI